MSLVNCWSIIRKLCSESDSANSSICNLFSAEGGRAVRFVMPQKLQKMRRFDDLRLEKTLWPPKNDSNPFIRGKLN